MNCVKVMLKKICIYFFDIHLLHQITITNLIMKTFFKNFIQKAEYQYTFCFLAAMYFLLQIIFRY